ncbi:ATP-dependent acyl-CoA ligase [Mesorhizobium sp. M0659]|uniref:ATP-dependent acyl-CoA ligase n=1 Tax=Mesorhizobium sp. M0659 TaxID=2956980 RepID=UPI0033368530
MIPADRFPEGAEAYCGAARARQTWLVDHFGPRLRTLPALLEHQAKRFGGRTLFIADGRTITFQQAPDLAACWAGMLAANGLSRGDRLGVLCGNRPEFMELTWGAAWLGATLIPINIASRGFQLRHILSNSGAKMLCIEAELLGSLDTIDRQALALERVFAIGATGSRDLPPGVDPLPPAAGPIKAADVRMSDLLAILYTSGTTGLSKGVCCPHGQYFWWAIHTGRQLGIREGDVLHTSLPLFHTNALNCFFQALLNGATQVTDTRFSVSRFWTRLRASNATVTYLLGAMVPMLMSQPRRPEERDHDVRVALTPGVPGTFHTEFTQRTGIVPLDGFGSTESNAVIGTTLETLRPGCMGRLSDGFEARVVDEYDHELADGMPGELILRADQPYAFASGYFAMPDKTLEAWQNLWLHTGDRVVREPDGYYRFVDRIKDTIRRRGENISSYEVEQAVLSHPAVSMVAAFPVSSELAEDEVMVAIIARSGLVLDPVDLIRHCEVQLPYFAVPRFIDIVADLPRTENGKVQKFKLRETGITSTTWDREQAGVTVKR